MIRLWCEFIGLYVALPVALAGVRLAYGAFPVLPILWVAALPAAVCLARRYGWGRREFFGLGLSRGQAARMAFRLALAGAVLTGGLLLVAPGLFLELPRRDPRLWALVMAAYPVLSVYPQGILYRGLFFARYAALFPGGRSGIAAGAAVFCLAHLLFANVWALALTLAGGVLFVRTHRATGSMLAADVEHAVCGQMVFTCGWGRFLYHGVTRLVEGGAPF
ncbi:MAG: CPBP family intramembrane metalloprotease [Verrucomicrobiota bacterium]|jgi:hypothetical protein|nr:CPBP family intramembrane metalloprotease [Verrucomicrobiota bacterium]